MTDIFLKAIGGPLQHRENEIMHHLLEAADFSITNNPSEAQLVILNACASLNSNECAAKDYLANLKHNNKRVVLVGDLHKTSPKLVEGLSNLSSSQIQHIVEVVEETLHKHPVSLLVDEPINILELPHKRKNPAVEILPISTGVQEINNFSILRKLKGKLHSYPIQKIVEQAKKAVESGAKELWLTSYDLGYYGTDKNTNLLSLLSALLELASESTNDFKIRIPPVSPVILQKYKQQFIELLNNEHIFNSLNITLQNGSQTVINNMGLQYDLKEVKETIKEIKTKCPKMNLSLDLIVGFPGESEKDFEQTLALIKEINPTSLHVHSFSHRPGLIMDIDTKQDQESAPISKEVQEKRIKDLSSSFDWIAFENNKEWINWTGSIIIHKPGVEEGFFEGRNESFRPVLVRGDFELGESVNVKIFRFSKKYLYGVVVN